VLQHEATSGDWLRLRSLLSVIEQPSPGTAHRERFTERRMYEKQGFPMLWLADLDADCVEVWTPTDTHLAITTALPVAVHERMRRERAFLRWRALVSIAQ
jgi:hypothetical protein